MSLGFACPLDVGKAPGPVVATAELEVAILEATALVWVFETNAASEPLQSHVPHSHPHVLPSRQ